MLFFGLGFVMSATEKNQTMRKLIFMLLLTGSIYSQEEVFNVQRYCIDEKPLRKGECDISGNEYSFVFLDIAKKEVVLFLTDTRMEYKIVSSGVASDPKFTSYLLENDKGQIEMKINKPKNRMEFLLRDTHIYLTIGKSTKMESAKL